MERCSEEFQVILDHTSCSEYHLDQDQFANLLDGKRVHWTKYKIKVCFPPSGDWPEQLQGSRTGERIITISVEEENLNLHLNNILQKKCFLCFDI